MRKKSEEVFRDILRKELEKRIKDYKIMEHERLIYRIIINENLQFMPISPKDTKRRGYTFQTDLLIKDPRLNLPLVVIETKVGGFNTHDVITYSSKAQKHKQIYPYLRYGLVVEGKDVVQNKFFTHNIGFDFAFAMREIDENSLNELSKIVEEQIKNAELILDIIKNKNQVRSFSTQIKIDKISK